MKARAAQVARAWRMERAVKAAQAAQAARPRKAAGAVRVAHTSEASREAVFELELFGGSVERRYRRAQPAVSAMPWGSLDVAAFPAAEVLAAARSWALVAFQE